MTVVIEGNIIDAGMFGRAALLTQTFQSRFDELIDGEFNNVYDDPNFAAQVNMARQIPWNAVEEVDTDQTPRPVNNIIIARGLLIDAEPKKLKMLIN